MIIDFHTHIFPDKIADRAIASLEKTAGEKARHNGKLSGLKETMKEAGIDISVILPIVVKPDQYKSINEFAYKLNKEGNLSFGSVHPDMPVDIMVSELKDLRDKGFKGIKLHPDYQNVLFNDIRYKRIVDKASELDLIVLVHAGLDPLSPECIHATPAMAREVIREVEATKLVLAHMGGFRCYDEAEDLLVGENVYFDTGVVFDDMEKEQLLRMINAHGADKILFGTDSPWADQRQYVKYMEKLEISNTDRDKIMYKNAVKLLGL